MQLVISEDMFCVADSDETDKLAKKDLLKRKEKKDKKDKERGYAALEGESSADENDSR